MLVAGAGQATTLSGGVGDGAGGPLAAVVITATPAVPPPPAAASTAIMDQRGREFMPHVLAVRRGTAVSFPNSDRIQHHVYSFSGGNAFEIKLYRGTPPQPIVFNQPGIVVLGCNIHDWMLGYIYVADTPYFTVSDAHGQWALDLPPGRYRLSVWHPDAETGQLPPAREVEIGPAPPPPLDLRLPLRATRRSGKPPATLQEQSYSDAP